MPRSPQPADSIEPIRQGFVGYIHVEGLQWREMLRLRLEDEAWWRGRLWFSESGGTEGWDKEGPPARTAQEPLRQARALPAQGLFCRVCVDYVESRAYLGADA